MSMNTTFSPLSRRAALKLGGAFGLASLAGQAAFADTTGDRKLIIVILRGALDGLTALAPADDGQYRSARGQLALPQDQVLATAEGFGLHPALKAAHGLWSSGELALMHAASGPYRDRSHFDGQDVLEGGGPGVFATSDGWLNRAIALRPGRPAPVAIAASLPLILRGPAQATSWSPSIAPVPEDDTLTRLMRIYDGDAVLEPALAQAMQTADIVGDGMMNKRDARRAAGQAYAPLATAATKLLTAPGGPEAAVLSFDGWDTHANQGGLEGALARRLGALDDALSALKTGMGAHWPRTAILVMTEFGRTVALNGSNGTDHGTGGLAWLAGGAVKGGRILGDWPGLAPKALYDGRDLAPANDLRALAAGVLQAHWGLSTADLKSKVFPGLGSVTGELLRT
jgi:uncharacterized protein (DUF1501 family)